MKPTRTKKIFAAAVAALAIAVVAPAAQAESGSTGCPCDLVCFVSDAK